MFLADFLLMCRTVKTETKWFRSSHRRCPVRKGVLRNFAKFTGEHLWATVSGGYNSLLARKNNLKMQLTYLAKFK